MGGGTSSKSLSSCAKGLVGEGEECGGKPFVHYSNSQEIPLMDVTGKLHPTTPAAPSLEKRDFVVLLRFLRPVCMERMDGGGRVSHSDE